jgi:hypothetical protein
MAGQVKQAAAVFKTGHEGPKQANTDITQGLKQ